MRPSPKTHISSRSALLAAILACASTAGVASATPDAPGDPSVTPYQRVSAQTLEGTPSRLEGSGWGCEVTCRTGALLVEKVTLIFDTFVPVLNQRFTDQSTSEVYEGLGNFEACIGPTALAGTVYPRVAGIDVGFLPETRVKRCFVRFKAVSP